MSIVTDFTSKILTLSGQLNLANTGQGGTSQNGMFKPFGLNFSWTPKIWTTFEIGTGSSVSFRTSKFVEFGNQI